VSGVREDNMLTCFESSTNVAFQKILRFFLEENSIILDITYGRGLSWNNLNGGYNLIKVDKRKTSKEVIQMNFNEYLTKKENESVDGVYFDPPYYFIEKIKQFDIRKQIFNNQEEVFWTENEFKEALLNLKKNIPRILKQRGIFIAKLMDGYIGKKYYPNAFKLFDALQKVTEPIGIFICPIRREDLVSDLIRTNHIYYLVFQKKEKENEL